MLPAWVNEPAPTERYAGHEGEDQRERRGYGRREERGQKRKRPTSNVQRPTSKSDQNRGGSDRPPRDRFGARKPGPGRQDRHRKDRRGFVGRQSSASAARTSDRPLPPIAVKFLPRVSAFENVVAQIKSGSVAYSLFALARLFLEKPVGYQVCVTAKQESPLYQLGDSGMVSADREFLERNAFRFAHPDFYKIDVSETDPIKGNFSNVARCRLSGTLL